MLTDLERRRQAIADALRAVMAEPLPKSVPAPVPAPARAPQPQLVELPGRNSLIARLASPSARNAESELPTVREALSSQIEWEEFDEHDDRDDVDLETPAVPPLEAAGSMSRAASVALFGHA
ncbi:MAG TPA: hypothetical protein VHV79_12440 [Mycobacteriales bacterium]|jgi:hypothetical protein|nr:hypothetical protein [Mycobacteriales bacterium]